MKLTSIPASSVVQCIYTAFCVMLALSMPGCGGGGGGLAAGQHLLYPLYPHRAANSSFWHGTTSGCTA